jgi:hypothetical protein
MFIATEWNDKELTILGHTDKWANAMNNIKPKTGRCYVCRENVNDMDADGIVYHRQIVNNMPKIVCTICEDNRKKAEYSHGSGNVKGVEYTIAVTNCKKSDIEYLVGEGFGRIGKSARKYGADFSSLQKPSKNLHELFDNRGCEGGIVVTIRKNDEIVDEIKFKYGNGHTISELISILQTI